MPKRSKPPTHPSSPSSSITLEKESLPASKKGIVETRNVDPRTLDPNPLNWRKHGINQKKALRASRERFGDVRRVIVNRRTNRLVDGHARVEDAIAQGDETVPVDYVDLSEEDEAELLLILDSVGSMATPDGIALHSLAEKVEANRKKLLGKLSSPETNRTLANLYASIREKSNNFATNAFSIRGQRPSEEPASAIPETATSENDDDGDYEPFEEDSDDDLSHSSNEENSTEQDSESDAGVLDTEDYDFSDLEGASLEEAIRSKEKLQALLGSLDHESVPEDLQELAVSLVDARWPVVECIREFEIPALHEDVADPTRYVQAEDLPSKMIVWEGRDARHTSTPDSIYCISSMPYPVGRTGGYLFTHTNDYRFDHLWKEPAKYALQILDERWKGVLEPEYSLFGDNDFPVNLSNLYRRRRLSRYYQELGIPIIPVISSFANEFSAWLPIDSLPLGVPVLSMQIRGLPRKSNDREKEKTRLRKLELILATLQYAVEEVQPKAVILYGASERMTDLEGKLPSGPVYLPTLAYQSARREILKRRTKEKSR